VAAVSIESSLTGAAAPVVPALPRWLAGSDGWQAAQPGILQAIVEGTTDAVFVKDLAGRYLMINPAGARFLGRSVEDVLGRDDTELFSTDTAAAIIQGDRRVLASGRTLTYEDRGTSAGVTRTYLSTKGVVRDAAGQTLGLFGISRDITQRKWEALRVELESSVYRVVSAPNPPPDAGLELLRIAGERLAIGAAALWLHDRDVDVLRCEGFWAQARYRGSDFERRTRELTLSTGDDLPGACWRENLSLWWDALPDDPAFSRAGAATAAGLHGCAALPLRSGRDLVGVLELFGGINSDPDPQLVRIANWFTYQLGLFLGRQRMEQSARHHRDELRFARRILDHLLPARAPELRGWSVHGATFPAEIAGGDCFDYVPMRTGLGLLVGDASGHGYASALLMATARAYVRAYAQASPDVGFVLDSANRVLAREIPDSQFVTACLARLDRDAATLTYAAAGQPPPIVFDRTGAPKALLSCGNLPLGVMSDTRYATETVDLEPGDQVVFVTDGLLEARSPERETFGLARLQELVEHYCALGPRGLVGNVYHGVRAYTRAATQEDDYTILVVRRET
jgi:PAS domain S-box-containing protein